VLVFRTQGKARLQKQHRAEPMRSKSTCTLAFRKKDAEKSLPSARKSRRERPEGNRRGPEKENVPRRKIDQANKKSGETVPKTPPNLPWGGVVHLSRVAHLVGRFSEENSSSGMKKKDYHVKEP